MPMSKHTVRGLNTGPGAMIFTQMVVVALGARPPDMGMAMADVPAELPQEAKENPGFNPLSVTCVALNVLLFVTVILAMYS